MKRFANIFLSLLLVTFIYNCSSNKQVYTFVEEMPSFPGGDGDMQKFIFTNLKYPAKSIEYGVQGRVTLRFIVTKTGEITDIENIRDTRGDSLADSLIQVIKKMPNWIPGKHEGKAVDVYYTLPLQIHPRQ